ncbi:hypothetical protein BK140_22735 [Paenibacillus macerans]|nr:hypothetical protein BK140_22735 [Paenibacillus macerans]
MREAGTLRNRNRLLGKPKLPVKPTAKIIRIKNVVIPVISVHLREVKVICAAIFPHPQGNARVLDHL